MQMVLCRKKINTPCMRHEISDHRNVIFSYSIVLLQGYVAWTTKIDLRSGAQFVFYRMTYILSPKCVFCISPFVHLLSTS